MHEPETDAAPGVTSDPTQPAPQYPSCLTAASDRQRPDRDLVVDAVGESASVQRARRARIGVGAAHHAELLIPGAVAGKVAYLGDNGVPIVLAAGGDALPAGRCGLRIAVPGGGQVALIGQLATGRFGREDAQRVGALLVAHRHCLTGMLDREGATPVRFEVETVLFVRGRQTDRDTPVADVGPEVVALVDYAEVDPDLFDELGPSLAAHLTEDHQDLLMELGRRLDIDTDLLAVGARDVSPNGVTLDIVGLDGSSATHLAFPRPLVHPHQFGPALRRYASERSA